MIGLIQRVSSAYVEVEQKRIANIDNGILLLLGVEQGDTEEIARKLAKKVCNLRIFGDDQGKMNLSVIDKKAEMIVVSQFTLAADLQSGNRPSFSKAAPPQLAESLYDYFVEHVNQTYLTCQQGKFAADMQVGLINDGPVTFKLQIN